MYHGLARSSGVLFLLSREEQEHLGAFLTSWRCGGGKRERDHDGSCLLHACGRFSARLATTLKIPRISRKRC